MKIFISYGHNDHTRLVNALFDALERAGHEPWKDDRYEGWSGIPAGRDFTQVIYRAIDESDFVLAFVTSQTLDRDYCCDERQYAYNHKGSHFIQLRLDNVPMRLGNSRSYVDMDEAEMSNGEINDTLFGQKLQSIFAAIQNPESFAAGGWNPWAKFETHLRVIGAVSYGEIISMPQSADFVGREWLREQCIRWATDETIPCRLFVILGEAGTGKTAFVRHLAADRALVRAVHVCRYDRPATRTVRDTIKDLSYVLAQNNRRYFEYLKNKPFDKLEELTPDGLFEFLFLDPLRDESEKYLLIIDGLDELNETTDFKALMRLFREYAHRLNPNISILVTGRPDADLLKELSTIVVKGRPAEQIRLDGARNSEDLARYIDHKLTALDINTPELARRLLTACDGNFEYLALLFQEVSNEGLRLSGETVMPRGLYARYTQYLERRMEMARQGDRLTRDQRSLLSVMATAEEPLPMKLLAEITDMDEDDAADELSVFGSLIRTESGERVSLFSKRFRDYLLESPVQAFRVRCERGDRAIAEYVIHRCKTAAALAAEPYLASRGLLHVLRRVDSDPETEQEAAGYLIALQKTGADVVSNALASALGSGDGAVLRAYCRLNDRVDPYGKASTRLKALRDLDSIALLASAYEAAGQEASALALRGDLARKSHTPEGDREAEVLFLRALTLREQAVHDAPGYETRRSLTSIYEKLGNLARQNHTVVGGKTAFAWFEKCLPLDKQNYAENPCYDSRRCLRFTYSHFGDLARDKHTPQGDEEAKTWYDKMLALDEQNYAESPSYESRGSLSSTCDRIGNLMRDRHTPEGVEEAAEWYRRMLALDEQNYAEYPSYGSRVSLSVTYERLGDLARRRHTPDGVEEAEAWYKKELALDEQNYAEYMSYESRRSLGIVYNKLGDIARDRRTPKGVEEAAEWYQKMMVLDEQNYAEYPSYESRRSLSITYERLGNLAEDRHTPEGVEEAEAWYKKELALAEQNYAEYPSYESRRSLSITCGRLGRLAQDRHTPQGNEEAEALFRRAVALDEENYAQHPCSESKSDLQISQSQLSQLMDVIKSPLKWSKSMNSY